MSNEDFPLFEFFGPPKANPNPKPGIISEDNTGNYLFRKGKTIMLKLRSETKPRRIAVFIEPDVIVVTRSRERHLHKKSNSYGINYRLLTDWGHIRRVKIRDEFGLYELAADYVRQCPCLRFTRSHDGNEYELQYFVPLRAIEEGLVSP